jgi:hypothetical protein
MITPVMRPHEVINLLRQGCVRRQAVCCGYDVNVFGCEAGHDP